MAHNCYIQELQDSITFIKEKSSFSVIQLDFAQNFAPIQRHNQHTSHQQAAILTFYIKVGQEYRSMVSISDCLAHDTKPVYHAQNIIIIFPRKNIRLIYMSDGVLAHFKSKCLQIFN